MDKQQALKRFDEISDLYQGKEGLLEYFATIAICQPDTPDDHVVDYCKRYFPNVVDPLQMWNHAKEQVSLLDVIFPD